MKKKSELDEWVRDILVDPLGKDTLTFTSELAKSIYGRNCSIVNNVVESTYATSNGYIRSKNLVRGSAAL